ncbi:hypothetical protein [Streptomyces sp. NBRC 14336]|uniref:hypothetical protein n=1 Tax=Streptomyces sp. NBRC 14336 TaxID=3030992 RepID=UPI002557B6F3|nr:hypothetical protein [Streptomyces sp. NBRC 14336]
MVELFPPSELNALKRALDRKSWESARMHSFGEGNKASLERSRSGRGAIWWRVGKIASATGWIEPGAIRGNLNAIFSSVELTASQVGDGLTAVAAFFRLSKEGAELLDKEWKKSRDPSIVWRRGRPIVRDRQWTTFRVVQQSRRHLHAEARKWMTSNFPGAFARRSVPQSLVDLLIFEEYDPAQGSEVPRDRATALRALGVSEHHYLRTSPSLPGLVLEPVGEHGSSEIDEHVWGLYGNMRTVMSGLSHLEAYGGQNVAAIASRCNTAVREALCFLSLSNYLDVMQVDYSELRDEARTRHGKFSARRLKRMRDSFLGLSMDLSSAVRDLPQFHDSYVRSGRVPVFTMEDAPWLASRLARSGQGFPSVNFTQMLADRQKAQVAELATEDKDYREILTAVASLGASIDTFKIGRIALWVSLVSLVVALVALLLAEVQSDTVLSHLLDWV